MPYLPRPYTHDTEFPEAFDRDLRTQIGMIEEQAKRFFPKIPYYCISKTVGIALADPVTRQGSRWSGTALRSRSTLASSAR